jgi:hypothetical protein
MANGDCPIGARNAARLDNLEREMGEIRVDQHKQQDCLNQLVTQAAVRTAELDSRSKLAVAYIAGGFTLLGVIINAVIVFGLK